MERKVVELVKSALKKMTNRERKLFLRLLSEELAKELIRRRRLRKQEEREDVASKISDVLRSEIRFEWTDFWSIYHSCSREEEEGSRCPVKEYLGARHPDNILPEDGMDFMHKIDIDAWTDYFEPEELREFLENEGVQNKVRRELYHIMWDKLEDAVEAAKEELEGLEEMVDQDPDAELEGWGEAVRMHLHEISQKLDNIVDTGPQDYEVERFFNKLVEHLRGIYNWMLEREVEEE